MKSIITKANNQGDDKWNAILEWENSPTPSQGNSPVQRLMSRRTRSFLPCMESLYKPEVQSTVAAQVMMKRKLAKCYHDVNAKPLPSLLIGQSVRVKVHPQKPDSDWKAGVILKNVAPGSYLVEVNGRKYRRNRIHLRDQPTIPDSDQSPMLYASHSQLAAEQTEPAQGTDPSNSHCPTKAKGCSSQSAPAQPSGPADLAKPSPSKQVMRTRSG